MNILVADKLPNETLTALSDLGMSVQFEPKLSADDLPTSVHDAQVLVVRSTRVTKEALEAGKSLQLVIRAGAGTNTIDCETAARLAIHVANCPGKNAVAVAELTLGLILSLDRRIPDNVASLRAGKWEKGRFGHAAGLLGRTIGIIGMGQIGQEVVHRARAFGMDCIAWSRSLTVERASVLGVERCSSVLELCRRADVVSIHLAYSDETHHIVGTEELAAMKDGAFLVHVARGGVVDDQALLAEVRSGRIFAACDVYEEEPKGSSSSYEGSFADVAGFYGTHHIGASTQQAQLATGTEVVRIVARWMKTGEVENVVNRSQRTPGCGQLLVRHLDHVGVLATILDVIKSANISVKEMKNTVFDDTGAATATITLDQAPTQGLIDEIRSCRADVLAVEWVPF
jgi:D-3-phosphoglycerate dehydrogenase